VSSEAGLQLLDLAASLTCCVGDARRKPRRAACDGRLDLTGLDLVKLEEKTESDRILPNRVVGEILAKCCECIGKMLLGGRANDLVVLGGVGHDRLGER
jgi:hypothetical protein